MFEVKVTISAPELVQAINNLAAALTGIKPAQTPQQVPAPAPQPQAPAPAQPNQAPQQTQSCAPVNPTTPAGGYVPTAAPAAPQAGPTSAYPSNQPVNPVSAPGQTPAPTGMPTAPAYQNGAPAYPYPSNQPAPTSPDLLTPEQMGEVLRRGETLADWYKTVKEKALERILSGTKIPGYKAVEGRSIRAWSNQDKALETLLDSGIERAAIYDSVPKTLAQLEKMLGKAKFGELVGEFVIKPPGAPTLASENDPKPAYNSAAADFAAVAEKE